MDMKKRALFIDRDGTILVEPEDEQIDSFEKFQFVEGVIRNLYFIRTHLDFDFVMVSNQDGLGTEAYPEKDFWPTHNLMLQTLKLNSMISSLTALSQKTTCPHENLVRPCSLNI